MPIRSEEHTSELQSPCNLVCRLLLEKKKQHPPLAVSHRHGRPGKRPAPAHTDALNYSEHDPYSVELLLSLAFFFRFFFFFFERAAPPQYPPSFPPPPSSD